MIQRRFLGWSRPALPTLVATLVEPAEGYADPPSLDLRSQLFVFPGGRPGRRFVELLAREAEARSLRLSAPRTLSVGALPELLYEPEQGRGAADDVLSRQLWARALQEIPGERLRLLVPDLPDSDDPAAWGGLADMVVELHRAVTREGVAFDAVVEECGGALLFDDSERWKVLAEVRRRYLDLLRGVGRWDRHEARIAALREEDGRRVGLDSGIPDPVREIHLVGIADVPGVVGEMLLRVAAAGVPVTAWIKAPEAVAERFDDLGAVLPDAWTDVEIPVPDEVLDVVDDPGDQATAALRAMADLDGAYAADEITVGVPDGAVVPHLEQRFRQHGVPHRLAEGTPLDRTSPFRLLRAVADYLDGRRFVDLAALLRHPALARLLDGGRALEVADGYHSTHLPARVHSEMPRSRPPRHGEEARPGMEEILARLHGPEVLGPLDDGGGDASPTRRRLSEWMAPVLGLVERVFGEEALDPTKPGERIVIETCRQLGEVASSFRDLSNLTGLPPKADPRCSAAQAIRLLLGQLRASGSAIPPEPERAATELLGWLELHLDDAPALVVTGFNEGFVPDSVNAHPFLPNALRRELGLTDNETRRARDAYLLSALLESRESVRIVAGRVTASGEPLRPSRLLLTDRGEALAERILRFASSEGESPPPIRPPGIRAAGESAFVVPPQPELRLPEPPESYSVTEFRALLQDPYRWALERHLRLDALHDGIRELDPLGFGVLAHDILRDFSRTEEAAATDPEAVADRLDRLLNAAAARRFGSGALPAVHLQVEQLRHRLRAFAEWQAARVARGWTLRVAEIGTPEGGVPFDVDGRPVHIRGRIDRIEVHAETGAVAVFDYKTGDRVKSPDSTHRDRSGAWRDLQLPLYRFLLPHLRLPGGEPVVEGMESRDVHLGYIRVPKDVSRVGAALAAWEAEEIGSALERARDVVRHLRENPVITFDEEVSRTTRWDPMGPLLGRGILSLAGAHGEDGESEGGEDG